MSEVVRLTLISHAMTDAMSAGRFPADEPLNDLGRRQLGGLHPLEGELSCGPELRTRQTAEALGTAVVDPVLADLDHGGWCGRTLDALDGQDLAVWLTDPAATPHGGESIVALCRRVGDWLGDVAARGGRNIAVTHPALIRAAIMYALDAPPKSFWRIDIGPVSQTVLHHRGRSWTLRY
ncbi:histidine phosphatase family protein [Mycobacterium sp. C31M]